MIVYYDLFLKEVKETVSNSIGLLNTLSNGGMTGLEFIKDLHGLLEIIICQEIFPLLLVVVALIKLVAYLGHQVL